MAITKIETINKREQCLHLDSGFVVEIRVEQNAVGIYTNSTEVGRLQFRSLMSANSTETHPLYMLDDVSVLQPELQSQAQDIATAAVDLFREYMGACIRLPKNYATLFTRK